MTQPIVSFKKGRWSPGTQLAYANVWKDWEAFCNQQDILTVPAAPEMIAKFLLAREHAHSTSALSQRLAAIRAVHAAEKDRLGKEDPNRMYYDLDAAILKDTWKEILRRKGNRHTPKEAIGSKKLKELIGLIPTDTPQGLKDRAMLLVHFAVALRRSETVALNLEDIAPDEHGDLLVHIRRSKTDQEGHGVVLGIRRTGNGSCPVAALEAWLAHRATMAKASQEPTAPLFVDVRRGTRLTGQMVAWTLKEYARLNPKLKLDPARIGAHSTRRGRITDMNDAKVSMKDGMELSRHKTPQIYMAYIQGKSALANPGVRESGL
jgi:site-specific recombinase XerC